LDHPIFHFTSIENLPSILAEGALTCDATVSRRGILKVEAGDRDIKELRRRVAVSVGPLGCPADYVPFYYAPRSPMLYKIERGGVPTYSEGQRPLVYFVSSALRVDGAGLKWVCSDGNCAHTLTSFYDDLDSLEQCIDWPVMKLKIWRDTAEDPDRMRRRMAEFLVYEQVPLDVIAGIGTFDDAIANQVRHQLEQARRALPVVTRRDWYY
jgi:hypothetical protein